MDQVTSASLKLTETIILGPSVIILMSLLGAEALGQRQSSAARPGRSERLSCGEGTQETDLPSQGKGGSRPSSVQTVHSLGRVLAVGKGKCSALPSD